MSDLSRPVGVAPDGSRYGECFRCRKARQEAGGHGWTPATRCAFVTYAVGDQTSGQHMHQYKHRVPAAREIATGLTLLLYATLRDHLPCLTATAQRSVDVVCHVPSSKLGGRVHPLTGVIDGALRRLDSGLHRAPCLVSADHGIDKRTLSPDRFAVATDVAGSHVLVVDDTWASGASAQSAAAALAAARAEVTILCIARWVDAGYERGRYLTDAIPGLPMPGPDRCPFTTGGLCP